MIMKLFRFTITTVLFGIALFLLLNCSIAAPSASADSATPAAPPASPTPQPDPDLTDILAGDYDVQTLDGKRVKLASLVGRNKPVLINLWATWCGPCRVEVPHLVELAQKYEKQGLIVVGLTIDQPQQVRQVREFMKRYGIDYPVAFAARELYFELNNRSPRMAVPQNFVYDREGRLVRRIIGFNPRLFPDILIEAIDKTFAPKPGSND